MIVNCYEWAGNDGCDYVGNGDYDGNKDCDCDGNEDDGGGELPTNSFREAVTTKCIQHGPISLKNRALLMLAIISSMMILLMTITYFYTVIMMMMVMARMCVFPHNQSLLMY